jgi:hypothetical protein
LDALCLSLATHGEPQFSRRYSLSGWEPGRPLSLTVVPGANPFASFELLLRGERAAQEVSWIRESFNFQQNHILEEEVSLERCSGAVFSLGDFESAAELPSDPGSPIATIHAALAPNLMILLGEKKVLQLAYTVDRLKEAQRKVPALPPANIRRILPVDVDGDCDQDLLFLSEEKPFLWLNAGEGNFSSPRESLPLAGSFIDAAAADLNEDQLVDLVLVTPLKTALLLNNPESPGTFINASSSLPQEPLAQGAQAVEIGHLNDDSKPEVVLAKGGSGMGTDVILSNNQPALPRFAVDPFGEKQLTQRLALLDLNQDGIHEIVTGATDREPQVYRNTASGANIAMKKIEGLSFEGLNGNVKAILAADVDNDCDEDLIFSWTDRTRIFLARTETDFEESLAPNNGSFPGAHSLAAADVNGDGLMDLLLGSNGASRASWLLQKKK